MVITLLWPVAATTMFKAAFLRFNWLIFLCANSQSEDPIYVWFGLGEVKSSSVLIY